MTAPFYEDEYAKIYHGSMTDLIDELKFDMIITDPPYNISYKYPDYHDNMNEEEYINLFTKFQGLPSVIIHYPEAICNYIASGIGPVNKIVSWCYNNNGSSKAHRAIAFFNCMPNFNKVRQPYKNPTDKRVAKLIANGSKGARLYDWFNDIQMIKNVSKEKCKDFTNQIPIQLLERIILLCTNEGDTIIDPFFGSGSLYFACKKLNRKCIGIELSKEHLECFKSRLKKHV